MEKYQYREFEIEIKNSYETNIIIDNPRETNNNLTLLALCHKRYRFENEANIPFNSFGSWEEVEEYIHNKYKPIVISEVYMMDHSGICLSLSDFGHMDSARWDWGQLGYIFIPKSNKKACGKTNPKDILTREFKEYKCYVENDYIVATIKPLSSYACRYFESYCEAAVWEGDRHKECLDACKKEIDAWYDAHPELINLTKSELIEIDA